MRVPCRQMLTYIDNPAITRNASEKKVNSLLDFMAQAQDVNVLQVSLFIRLLTCQIGNQGAKSACALMSNDKVLTSCLTSARPDFAP